MEDLASMRYNIINPMIITFVEQEKKFFGTCFSLINNFYNGMYKLQGQVPYQKSNYDPMKYTRASKIMEGLDTNSLPSIKMKSNIHMMIIKIKFKERIAVLLIIFQLLLLITLEIIIVKQLIKSLVLKIIRQENQV